jgi:hypothetical protein
MGLSFHIPGHGRIWHVQNEQQKTDSNRNC